MRRGLPVAIVFVSLCACNSTDFRTDIEDRVTIAHGVYGQTLSVPADKGAGTLYWSGLYVYVLPDATDDEPYYAVRSGTEGLYQMSLDEGTYTLCTEQGDCTAIAIAPDARLRVDYWGGAGMGWKTPP